MSSTRRANKRARIQRRAENDAIRTARRDSLAVLLSRAQRGAPLTTDEAALLRAAVEAEIREGDAARTSERGQQRAMEQQRQRVEAAEAAIVEAEDERDRARAEVAQWRATYGPDALNTYRAALDRAEQAEQRAKQAEHQISILHAVDEGRAHGAQRIMDERDEWQRRAAQAEAELTRSENAREALRDRAAQAEELQRIAHQTSNDAEQARADAEQRLAAQHDAHDARRRTLADALGINPANTWPVLLDVARTAAHLAQRAGRAEGQLSESETLGHRLLQRAERAEEELTAARAQLTKATRRGDIWKAKAHEIEADRDRLAAELSDAERAADRFRVRADQADAVTAATKRLMQRRTTTLRNRAEAAERHAEARDTTARDRLARILRYVDTAYEGDVSEGVRRDVRRLCAGEQPTYNPPAPEVITDRATIRDTLAEPEPAQEATR